MTPHLRGITVVGLVCFLIGWAMTWPIFSTWSGDFEVLVSPVAKLGNLAVYETYALILVDEYNNPQPLVEAVWLAQVPSDFSTLDLVGLPSAPFRDQFSHALNGVPLLTLQPYLRGQLIGTITFDREDVKELVERTGSTHMLGQKMDGAELLNYLDRAEPDRTDDRLIRQAAVIQSVLAEMAAQESRLDLAGLMQTPSQCTVDQNKLYELVAHYYPIRTDLITVRPDLEAGP